MCVHCSLKCVATSYNMHSTRCTVIVCTEVCKCIVGILCGLFFLFFALILIFVANSYTRWILLIVTLHCICNMIRMAPKFALILLCIARHCAVWIRHKNLAVGYSNLSDINLQQRMISVTIFDSSWHKKIMEKEEKSIWRNFHVLISRNQKQTFVEMV